MASEENGTVDDASTEPSKQDERAQVILTCDEKGLLPDPLEDIQSSEIITSGFECSSGIDNHTEIVEDDGDNVLSVSITSTAATTCTVPPSSSAPELSESTTMRSTPSLTDANALLSTEIMDKSDEALDIPMDEQSPIVINVKKLPKPEPQPTKDTSVTVSAVRECLNFVLDTNTPLVANPGSAGTISTLTTNVGTTASVAPTNVLPVLSAGTNPIAGTFFLLTTSPTGVLTPISSTAISNSVPTISVQRVPSPVQAPLPQPISSQQPSASAKPPTTEPTEKTSSPTPSTGTNSSASTQSDRVQCLSCGTEGKKSSFVRNGRFCSHDCAYNQSSLLRAFKNPIQMKPSNTKKKIMVKGNKLCVQNMGTSSSHYRSVLPAASGDQSMRPEPLDALDLFDANDEVDFIDQWSDPPNCVSFNWKKYLNRTKSFCAPARCFKDFQVSCRPNNFAVGMKLEGVDPHHPSLYCVLTVAEILGARIRLHFDGYPDMYDFWVNCDSPFIFPVGWCRKTGRKLEPPKDHGDNNFNWQSYLSKTCSRPAPTKLFACERQSHSSNQPFRTGMKLEAVDKSTVEAATGQALVCVATIADIIDNWLLIHFDGWDDSYDYWTTVNSPYIHPVGWCREKSKQLTPPKDHGKGGRFKWEEYLKETNSVAAPAKNFRLRPPNQFRSGMKLEVVDRYSPRFIRVATVIERRSYSILVHFDGFESNYDFWCDDDSPDIHPVNWAVKNNHPLQPPAPYLRKSIKNIRCPTGSCLGQGNLRNPGLPSIHVNPSDCPYSKENKDKDIPDRLGHHEHEIDWVEMAPNCMDTSSPDTSYPDTSNRKRRREPSVSSDSSSEIVKKSHSSSPSLLMQNNRSNSNSKNSPVANPNLSTLHQAIFALRMNQHQLEAPVAWERHSKNLLSSSHVLNASEVLEWDAEKVTDFVETLPGCEEFAHRFEEEGIDGEAFLLINQSDLVKLLGIKLGPAVKIYNSILVIRDNINLEA